MRTLILVALLLPVLAMAQTAQPTLEQQALGITSWIAQMVQEITNLKTQNAALTAENDKLKAAGAKKPDAPPAAAP